MSIEQYVIYIDDQGNFNILCLASCGLDSSRYKGQHLVIVS